LERWNVGTKKTANLKANKKKVLNSLTKKIKMKNCKHCSEGCQKAKDNNETIWKCENTGIFIYKILPEGLRFATLEDIKKDENRNLDLNYLLYSTYSDRYEAYTISENTDMVTLELFIEKDRCWVKSAQ